MAAPLRGLGSALTPEARGILASIFAFFSFAAMDAIAKHLMGELHPMQVAWARYASQTLCILAMLAPRLGRVVRTQHLGLQFLRSLFLFAATLMFLIGLQTMKFAEAAALLQTAPLIIAALAGLVLGEAVGIRRRIGVGIGLIGALFIIRPGLDVFQPAALFPLGGACCLAAFQLATRRLSGADGIGTTLFYTTVVGTLVASAAVPFFWTQPTLVQTGLMLSTGAIAAIGHLSLIYGLGQAPASMLAPFNYTQLVWAATFGLVIFGEVPDAMMVVGAAVVVGAGLYVWHRERVRELGVTGGRG